MNQDSATQPLPRDQDFEWASLAEWRAEQTRLVGEAARGEAEIVFYGDSITAGWPHTAAWKRDWAPRKAGCFGIGGDATQNLLWRLRNGEVGRLKPKQVVLLIGSNNFGLYGQEPEEVERGIKAVIAEIQAHFPQALLWLMGVLPSEEKADHPKRIKIRKLNQAIEAMDSASSVRVLNLESDFIKANGDIIAELMPDFLHLSEAGYEVWSKRLKEAMKIE